MYLDCPEFPALVAGESVLGGVSYDAILSSSEALTGTPTVVELTTSHLTISSVAKNAAAVVISGSTVAANRAVMFLVAGMQVANTYRLRVTGVVNSTPNQTRIRFARFLCTASS